MIQKNIFLLGVEKYYLPPSPSLTDMQQEEIIRLRKNKHSNIINAFYKKKFNKTVSYINTVSPDEIRSEIGDFLLKAYRQIIFRWKNKRKFHIALKWSTEMIENLTKKISYTDIKRHNDLIKKLNKNDIKHSFKNYNFPSKKSMRCFTTPNWCKEYLSAQEKLCNHEKPNVAFDESSPVLDGIIFIDRRGKSIKNVHSPKSAIFKIDKSGNKQFHLQFEHEVYQVGTNPFCGGFALLLSNLFIYCYDEKGKLIFAKKVADKSQYIRDVAISTNLDKIAYVISNNIYCLDSTGKEIWKYTLKYSSKKKDPSSFPLLAPDVNEALSLFKLDLPCSRETIKSKYFNLSKRLHPDLHPEDQNAHIKMTKLNAAHELLKNINPEKPDYYEALLNIRSDIDYFNWISTLCFNKNGEKLYFGTIGGKIVEINLYGKPIKYSDIDNPPSKIFPGKQNIYVLTDTRLYIINNYNLINIKDIYNQGNIKIHQQGFWISSKNKVQFFSSYGKLKFEMLSTNPIRSIYFENYNLIVKSRRSKAIIKNLIE